MTWQRARRRDWVYARDEAGAESTVKVEKGSRRVPERVRIWGSPKFGREGIDTCGGCFSGMGQYITAPSTKFLPTLPHVMRDLVQTKPPELAEVYNQAPTSLSIF